MRTKLGIICMTVVLGWVGIGLAADPPALINYQGVLRSAADQPLDGSYGMVFRFYSAAVGGEEILVDDHTEVTVTGGLFSVELGAGTIVDGSGPGLYESLFEVFRDHGAVWLAIEVNGEALAPRVRVVSASYSLNAAYLGGRTAGEFIDTSGETQSKHGELQILGPASSVHLGQSDTGITADGDSAGITASGDAVGGVFSGSIGVHGDGTQAGGYFNTVGIGTDSPNAELEVEGDSELNGQVSVGGNLVLSAGLEFADGTVQTTAAGSMPPDTCFDNVGRFVVCGNGAVKDNLTGLWWLEDANCFTGRDWAAANIAAAQLGDGQCGLTDGSSPGDWRLPTGEEWQTMISQAWANDCSAPQFPDVVGTGCCGTGTCAFTGLQSDYYWSSTTTETYPERAWYTSLEYGMVFSDGPKTVDYLLVWPVRDRR